MCCKHCSRLFLARKWFSGERCGPKAQQKSFYHKSLLFRNQGIDLGARVWGVGATWGVRPFKPCRETPMSHLAPQISVNTRVRLSCSLWSGTSILIMMFDTAGGFKLVSVLMFLLFFTDMSIYPSDKLRELHDCILLSKIIFLKIHTRTVFLRVKEYLVSVQRDKIYFSSCNKFSPIRSWSSEKTSDRVKCATCGEIKIFVTESKT